MSKKNGRHEDLLSPDELRQSPAYNYLLNRGKKPLSQKRQRIALRQALALARDCPTSEIDEMLIFTFPWDRLRHTDILELANAASKRFASANNIMVAVKGTMKEAAVLDLLEFQEVDKLWHGVEARSANGRTAIGHYFTALGRAALLAACVQDLGPIGIRDAALLGLGLHIGYRISEAADLQLASWKPEGSEMSVRGKGDKTRELPVAQDGGARAALDDWLQLRGSELGYLFLPVRRGGAIVHRRQVVKRDAIGRKIRRSVPARISSTSLSRMLKRRADQAGLENLNISWHDLRRTAISDAIDAGGLAAAQDLAGHSSPGTTMRYDLDPDRRLRKTAELMPPVPYTRST